MIYYSCFLPLPVFMEGSTYVCQEPTFPKILSKICLYPCVCKSVFPLRPLYLCRLFVLALEWDRSPSRGTLMAFQVFPLSSLEVTPCRKYTARSSQLIANTYTQQQQQQQVDFNMSTCQDLLLQVNQQSGRRYLMCYFLTIFTQDVMSCGWSSPGR